MSHTAEYIKRQAKSIKKEDSITYLQALDKSAIICGFSSWRHFLNATDQVQSVQLPQPVNGQLTKMNPYRKLLIAAVNELLYKDLISLNSRNENYLNRGHTLTELFGYTTVILWEDIGLEELRISVWWKYDHLLHPQANLDGNAREQFTCSSPITKKQHYKKFVGAVASGWLERKEGKYIQGVNNRGIFETYIRKGEKEELEKILTPEPNGYKSEGKFRL